MADSLKTGLYNIYIPIAPMIPSIPVGGGTKPENYHNVVMFPLDVPTPKWYLEMIDTHTFTLQLDEREGRTALVKDDSLQVGPPVPPPFPWEIRVIKPSIPHETTVFRITVPGEERNWFVPDPSVESAVVQLSQNESVFQFVRVQE